MSKKKNIINWVKPLQVVSIPFNLLKKSLLDDVYKQVTQGAIQDLSFKISELKSRIDQLQQNVSLIQQVETKVDNVDIKIKILELQIPEKMQSLLQSNLSGVRKVVKDIIDESLEEQRKKIAKLTSKGGDIGEELKQALAKKAKLEASLELFNESFRKLTESANRIKYCKEAAVWLVSEREKLALEASRIVLDNNPELISSNEPADSIEKCQRFYQDIDNYLELISYYLSVGAEPILLYQQVKTAILPAYAYQQAFSFILNNKVSNNLSDNAILEIKGYFNKYLIDIFNKSSQ
ncbi:phycoerythrin alpha chain [Anabaenopsis circularis NIES-21]|uniref:Phycoerythrin alpha chain n=1 Tax=Anabaenopsis circularis NIES-21 TaxID=1085406 RepID=A0A1Z4G9X6_9CYAN|nr:phycoerythrin alpha chain [Anabaenopsis circularis NIES-21]